MRIDGAGAYAGVAAALRSGAGEVRRAYAAEPADAPTPMQQLAAVPQLNASEMTPRVRAVIAQLMEEADRVRRALDTALDRIKELEKLADLDTLTPLGNRRFFVRELARALGYRDRHNIPTALLFVDVDGLKAINDERGHAAGDAAILHVGRVLAANVRTSDTVARLSGDEFGVILIHADDAQAALKAQQLMDAISDSPVVNDGGSFTIGASIGICNLKPGDSPAETLARADRAMYVNKRGRKAA